MRHRDGKRDREAYKAVSGGMSYAQVKDLHGEKVAKQVKQEAVRAQAALGDR